jgi:hypothetical protein
VTASLSPPVRVFAFVGVLVAVGLGAFFFLVGRGDDGSIPSTSTLARTTQETTPVTPATPRVTVRIQQPRVAAVPPSGFPPAVDRALRRSPVVVLVVYMPNASVDTLVRAEAKAGAKASGAGYVAVSALSERLVRTIVAETGVLPDPAVVVLKRPGVVTATLSVTDRDTIAQAVAQARR